MTVSACNNDPQEATSTKNIASGIHPFSNTIDLTGKNIGPMNYFMNPVECISSYGYLLVFDTGKDTYLHLLNEDLSVNSAFLKKGNGPEELDSEPGISHHDFMRLGAIYYYDFVRSSIVRIPINKISGLVGNSSEEFPIPENLYNLQSVTIAEDSLFIGNGGMVEGKLFFFSPVEGKKVVETPFMPEPVKRNDREYLMYSYLGKVAWNPQKKWTYFANSYFPQLEVYDSTYNLRKVIQTESHSPSSHEKMFYYHGIDYGLNKVFALYLGENPDNLLKNLFGNFKSELHVFDEEGSPVLRIKLDRLLTSFTYDVGNGRIIGIDESNEEQPLVEYILPKELLKVN